MNSLLSICHSVFVSLLVSSSLSLTYGQDTIAPPPSDSLEQGLNMDAVYDRPFLAGENSAVAIGGYLEANTLYQATDGISQGLSFQARRLTVFLSANVTRSIKFLTEVELEDGGRELVIEFASLDFSIHPMLNLRGGVIMNPIGAFNQNHDGPKWEFVERPEVAVNLLAATWSNAGFGIYGKTSHKKWTLGYEAYISNGFNDRIIDNEENRTFLPAAKDSPGRFEESFNGRPLLTLKTAIKHRTIGEIGISYMGGVYNSFQSDGLRIARKRSSHVVAFDWKLNLKPTGTILLGELVFVQVDVPDTYTQQYGDRQHGFFFDVVQPVFQGPVLNWTNSTLSLAARIDYVDWNVGKFRENQADIGDSLWAITPAVSFRPSSQVVVRLNYRYRWERDVLNNPPSKSAAWLFGISAYF